MKVIRAPLRVSLFGGGTDLESYMSEHGSTIISFAIDSYMYLTWTPRPTGGCWLSYSQVEELETLRDAKHTLVREAAQRYGIPEPCTLTITSHLPKGTGLGSSSALAVCLMRLDESRLTDEGLTVHYAAAIEHAVSKAGWQDYLPAVHGGFNVYRIDATGFTVGIEEELTTGTGALRKCPIDLINRYGLLLYTGNSRKADSVLPSWQKSEAQLHEIKALADEMAGRIDDITPESLGAALSETWRMKRSIPGVSSPVLNEQFALAIAKGALGGKLCGAGAGGCWFFLVPPNSRTRANVVQALGLREIPFKISQEGVRSWEL